MPSATQPKSAHGAAEPDAPKQEERTLAVDLAEPRSAPPASPARALQERLASTYRLGEDSDDGRRWSPRAALALSGGISLLLWVAIGFIFGVMR